MGQMTKEQRDLEILPQWLDEALWGEFIKHRRDMATPARRARSFTARAQRMTIRKLGEIQQAGFDPNDSLKQSIERGWVGVFPCDAIRKAKGTPELRSYQNPKDPVRLKLKAANLKARAEQLGIEQFAEGAETRQHFEHRVAMAEMQNMKGQK